MSQAYMSAGSNLVTMTTNVGHPRFGVSMTLSDERDRLMVAAVGTRWFLLTAWATRHTVDRQHERVHLVEDTHGDVRRQ